LAGHAAWLCISYIGFTGSLLFYDAFITDVTTPDRMDKVSAWGYAMGYLGGSTIPFLLSILLIHRRPFVWYRRHTGGQVIRGPVRHLVGWF